MYQFEMGDSGDRGDSILPRSFTLVSNGYGSLNIGEHRPFICNPRQSAGREIKSWRRFNGIL